MTVTAGLFITLEGPEGCGKSTQAVKLEEWLRQRGHTVLLTREPGGTRMGEAIRALLHDPAQTDIQPATEILLYCAARSQLARQILIPHLRQGGTVVCDRFADSTFAYQGYGRGFDLGLLRSISHLAADGLIPHATFLLDLPIEIGLARKKKSGGEWNRMDAETEEFHRRVREGYRSLAREEPSRWIVIDASGDINIVWDQMEHALTDWLAGRQRTGA
jgi:dTMP kinase